MPIIDVTSPPTGQEKIFLGDFGNLIRVDSVSHVIAKNLKELSEGNVWFPKEINFNKDILGWEQLPPVARRMFQLNIAYQTVADSGVTNGYLTVLPKVLSSSIWLLVYIRIGAEEAIHAESYSYALSAMFGDKASEIIDIVYSDPIISTRLANEVDAFTALDAAITNGVTGDDMKKTILSTLANAYLLEHTKFPSSFLVTWSINEAYNSGIQGISRMLKLIANDELAFHVPTNSNVLNILRRHEDQGFKHLFTSGWFDEMFTTLSRTVYTSEREWHAHLLAEGPIKGYNDEIADHFLQYQLTQAATKLKVPSMYNVEPNDTTRWFDTYRDINKQNVAGQEGENASYQKGILVNDLGGVW